MRLLPAVTIKSVFTVLAALALSASPAFAADRPLEANAQHPGQDVTVEDLLRLGCELCRDSQYDLATWPLARAASLAKDDPRIQLWFAHALVQTGQLREGKKRLLATERVLAGPRGNTVGNSSLYLASVRNYLGVLAAIDRHKSEGIAWFQKAAEAVPKVASRRSLPANRNEDATAGATAIAAATDANRRLLEAQTQFASWAAPGEPLASSGRLKSNPGLGNEYARAADERRGRVLGRDNGQNAPPNAAEAVPPLQDNAPGAQAAGRSVPAVIVRLLDSSATLRQAQALAEMGHLNDALRLAEASRVMQPGEPDVYLLLADLFEAKGWFMEALDALDIAAVRATDGRRRIALDQKDVIARAHPALPLEPRGLLTSPHFRLRYGVPLAAARTVLAYLEGAHDDAIKIFGVEPPMVYVRLFAGRAIFRTYVAAAQKKPQPAWRCGYAVASPHSPAILLSAEVDALTVAHEYTHVVTRSLAGAVELPHWLEEGIAEVLQLGRATTTPHINAAHRYNRLPNLVEVEEFFSNPNLQPVNDDTVTLFYDVTRCIVSDFLNRCGDHRLIEWLLLIRWDQGARQSFERITGRTYELFYMRWAQNGREEVERELREMERPPHKRRP